MLFDQGHTFTEVIQMLALQGYACAGCGLGFKTGQGEEVSGWSWTVAGDVAICDDCYKKRVCMDCGGPGHTWEDGWIYCDPCARKGIIARKAKPVP